ncbi:TIGR03756 family integrating conjugative element protein [Vibrio splendidus]|uniref:Integrating conjugative element protein n=1 Tax=Vibrio splendidus TaxID=29497 RepID=A0A2N7K0B5_VIBSP|nr:integrating conjugative element protein [Vibrio splendidus]
MGMTRCRLFSQCLFMLSLSAPCFAQGVLTTPEVLSSSACPDCVDYQVLGVCVWMTCTPAGCSTDESVLVSHRLPETVVMSYPEVGEATWQPLGFSMPAAPLSKNGGRSTRRSTEGLDNVSMTFQNVDAIGHPGLDTIYEFLAGTGYFLRTNVTAMQPYYASTLDPLGWRWNIPDMFKLNSYNPFDGKLGTLGDVYPRGGFSTQRHPFKSAALAAYKAQHIITREGESRVYQSVVQPSYPGYWPPEPLSPQSTETAFQRLYPNGEMTAHVWPEFNDSLTITDPYAKQQSQSGQYAWAVWRTYTGCERRGAVLIFSTGR